MDRLRHIVVPVSVALCAVLITGCKKDSETSKKPTRSRYASVSKKKIKVNDSALCEVSYRGLASAPKYVEAPERPLLAGMPTHAPGQSPTTAQGTTWRWINIWASWCAPCIEEFPVLSRWSKTLAKENIDVRFELWSMDEDSGALLKSLNTLKDWPGRMRWFQTPETVRELFKSVGLDPMAPIPVHILVDPTGKTRCVRVGKIGEELYGTVRQILTGG